MIVERLQALADEAMAAKTASVDPERWVEVEKKILLQTLDHHWKEHLATLDALRQVIHLRSYAQKKPIDEYKQEAFLLFERLLVAIREDVTRTLMRAADRSSSSRCRCPTLPDFITQHIDPLSGDDDSADIDAGDAARSVALPPGTDAAARPMPDGAPVPSRSAAMRRARAARAASTSIATAQHRLRRDVASAR